MRRLQLDEDERDAVDEADQVGSSLGTESPVTQNCETRRKSLFAGRPSR